MALINCPECSKQISDRARVCPHCGLPFITDYNKNLNKNLRLDSNQNRKKNESKLYPILIIFLLIFLVGTSVIIVKQYKQILRLEKAFVSTDDSEFINTQKDISSDKIDSFKDENEEAKDEVQISVLSKGIVLQDVSNGIYSDYVTFEFDVKNNSDRGIRGVQGILIVKDLFGEEILRMNCDFVGTAILPGKSYIEKDLTYEINKFMDSDMKLFNTDYKDLNFDYNVTSIVYLPEQGNR